MQPNKAQIKMVNNVRVGSVTLPTGNNELADWLGELLLMRDHEAEEAPMMERCKLQFIRTAITKGNHEGWLYLSTIKNVLNRRVYFKDLDDRLTLRGIDTMRHIARSMIIDGLVKKNGVEVMITQAARDYLKQSEEF